jgi:hypothetical protein
MSIAGICTAGHSNSELRAASKSGLLAVSPGWFEASLGRHFLEFGKAGGVSGIHVYDSGDK